jgi:hypothetical protein
VDAADDEERYLPNRIGGAEEVNDSICDFSDVRVSIPRRMIRKHYNKHVFLSRQESAYFRGKRDKIIEGINQLNHTLSIVETILLRGDK